MAPTSTNTTPDCIVIGAGIAGVCAAIELQRRGAKVAIMDPEAPGSGASFGNAGIVVNTRLTPVFAGLTPRLLLSMLRNPASPLNIRWSKLPGLTPWFMRMLRHAGPDEVERITRALGTLCQPGADLYGPLWTEAGLDDLVEAKGNISLMRNEAEVEKAWSSAELLRSMGVPMEQVDRARIAEMAPSVSERYTHGLYSPDFHHTLDPQVFVQRLHDLFAARGGAVMHEAAQGLAIKDGSARGVITSEGERRAGSVVVAAGQGSAALARQAREGVPHQAVGGYHTVLTDPGVELPTPVLPMDFRFAITPMRAGIRLAGIYEFGGEGLAPQPQMIDRMLAHVDDVLPGISTASRTTWRGFRSYLPDGMPIISPSERNRGLYYLFGLSSAGMINGASAGRLLAQLWADEQPEIDPAPFAIARFL